MKKIAFCFLVYDDINHEDLWNLFFKDVDPQKYTIYIHDKISKPLKYFNKYKLKRRVLTRYSHISLVKAQNLMLQEAMLDSNNTHFIFVSNSCIPLKSFDNVYDTLNEEYSYFNICPREQCFPRCNMASKVVDNKYIQKAAQWCILNRKHAELMLNTKDYMTWFNYPGTVPDEHCYITNIHYNNLQDEIITTVISTESTTFTNWSDMVYKYNTKSTGASSLKNYDTIDKEELLYLLNTKCLFGRKFTKECSSDLHIEEYLDAIKSKNVL